MFAGINFLLAIFVYFSESAGAHFAWNDAYNIEVIPETRRVLLEEMDTKFGGSNHVEKGGDILGVKDTHHADLDQELPELANKDTAPQHVNEIRE